MLQELFDLIEERKTNPPPESYTARLFSSGGEKIAQKVGEEAVEVLLAAVGQSDRRVVEEAADLVYHLLVLLSWRNLTLDDVEAELHRRWQP
jgi:phosphoribosyl-ATP pyrophosphohydrolase